MKKILLPVIMLVFSLNANAATFDFKAYADNGLKDDNGTSFSEGVFTSATEDGITLNVSGTAYYGGQWNKAYGYLDEGNAGLGLCDTTNCAGTSDDNVNDGEKLVLDFGQLVTLGETTFRNKNHGTSFGGTIQLSIDGGTTSTLSLKNILDLSSYKGQIFEFYNLSSDTGADDFYISSINVSAIPLPATAFLFAPALLGFLGLRRKNVA